MESTIRHVIMGRPLRCICQMIAASKLAEHHGATVHMRPGCYGEPTRQRPGVGSDCMPLTARGADRCRHDRPQLRAEGAIEIGPDIECWPGWRDPDGRCGVCRGEWQTDRKGNYVIAFPNEYPDSRPAEPSGQLALF